VTFPDTVAAELARRGWTPAEFARRAEIPKQTIHRYLAGQREPSLGTAARLADTLGWSIDRLAGRKAPR
jgi:transcriptional regulator with XRE-family HTH domain